MTNKLAVWNLLLTKQGQWVGRAEIESVGGMEAMRRLREVREIALAQGYEFHQRRRDGVLEYQLTPVSTADPRRREWYCLKCRTMPVRPPSPSTDTRDRWRPGRCVICDNDHAIFGRV